MKRIKKEEKVLPLEAGKRYKTKFATGTYFTITRLDQRNKSLVWGIHENSQHLGECPLDAERLIAERVLTGVEFEVIVCPNCKHEFKEHD